MAVSVLDPISDAVDHVSRVLFKPFDLKTWFVMGFCAWLANLGQGGGGSNSWRMTQGLDDSLGGAFDDLSPWIWIGIAVGIALVLALTVAILWVSSRGTFMFIDNVVAGVARVSEPWNDYRTEGNALFVLRLILTVAFLGVIAVPVVGFFALAGGDAHGFDAAAIGMIGLVVVAVLAIVIAQWIVNDFIAPIMFLRRCGVGRAWHEAAGTISLHLGPVVLFALVKFLLTLALAAVAVVATCCTCLLTAVPYLGSVILLPLLVFQRSYSLFFLGRLGLEYERFRTMGPDVEGVAQTFE